MSAGNPTFYGQVPQNQHTSPFKTTLLIHLSARHERWPSSVGVGLGLVWRWRHTQLTYRCIPWPGLLRVPGGHVGPNRGGVPAPLRLRELWRPGPDAAPARLHLRRRQDTRDTRDLPWVLCNCSLLISSFCRLIGDCGSLCAGDKTLHRMQAAGILGVAIVRARNATQRQRQCHTQRQLQPTPTRTPTSCFRFGSEAFLRAGRSETAAAGRGRGADRRRCGLLHPELPPPAAGALSSARPIRPIGLRFVFFTFVF